MGETTQVEGVSDAFTCNDCGSHELVVTHEYAVTTYFRASIPCTCGEAIGAVAAQRLSHVTATYREWGLLRGRGWEYEACEETGIAEEEDDAFQLLCRPCVEKAGNWESTDNRSELNGDSHQFYLNCDGCDREIEFGWSEPERRGDIWPSEHADFRPQDCWPEPRYRERWTQKGWLQASPAGK